jgi:hypothetical protein
MPNWCQNNLTLTHDEPAMIKKALEAFQQGNFFNELVPRPAEEEDNWYNWNIDNWGTKWDVGRDGDVGDVNDTMISLNFDSAWSPPIAGYEKLEELGFTVEGYYYESGCAFCGLYACGVDDCYGIDGDSDWVVENIPSEIDEMFAISENMDMWEQDQAEEEAEQTRQDEKNGLYPEKADIAN